MSSRIEIWSGNGSTERVILELPEAVARAIASQPGNRWIDDFVAAVAELRPGGYEGALYAYAKKPETRPQYRAALESAIQKGRQTNRVAPGLQAELGYVLLEDGDKAGARAQFEGEMHDFPESKAFLKGVIDRLDGGTKKAEVAS